MLTNGRGFGILTNVVARERVRESETNEPESLKELERAPEGKRKKRRRAILENDTEKREKKEVRFRKSEQPVVLWRERLEGIKHKSLILAQDERWRRA